MRSPFVVFLVLAVADVALAASPDDVVEWTKAGVPEEEIVARIRREPPNARLGAHEALRLKAAGVSDAVLKALIDSGPTDTPPPPTAPSPRPESRIITSVDDIIAAHKDGVSAVDLIAAVRTLKLRSRRADRERMQAAGVPASVIRATTPTSEPIRGRNEPRADEFGASGTVLVELGGGLQHFSVRGSSATAVRVAPGLQVILGRFLTVGTEADFVISDGADQSSLFAVAGFAILASRSFLFRAVGRVGYGEAAGSKGGAAYGVAVSGAGRSGRLLAGAGLTATWSGDPAATIIVVDLRLGTWF